MEGEISSGVCRWVEVRTVITHYVCMDVDVLCIDDNYTEYFGFCMDKYLHIERERKFVLKMCPSLSISLYLSLSLSLWMKKGFFLAMIYHVQDHTQRGGLLIMSEEQRKGKKNKRKRDFLV